MDIAELKSSEFVSSPTVENARVLIRTLRSSKLFEQALKLGEYFVELYPSDIEIMQEVAICAHEMKYYELSYDIFETILQFRGLNEEDSTMIYFNQHFNIPHVENRFIHYNVEKVQEILNRQKREVKLVTLTITTCKRLDLFKTTMNTILNCLDTDMIDEWLCVDDNSSAEDIEVMKTLYPFFTFVFKDKQDKGHPRSMNIIKNKITTPYVFHLEDDWKFFCKRPFIREAMEVLSGDPTIGQCLINKNYGEIECDVNVKGGVFRTTKTGLRYYIHEHVTNELELSKWIAKHGKSLSSNYWPHYSLRPSLLRTSLFKTIGDFNEDSSHFEMEYAGRYAGRGFKSVFFEGLYCVHTGRLTSEKNDDSKINAYKLNDEEQFVRRKQLSPIQENSEVDLSSYNFRTLVLNLDRRKDRWDKFVQNNDSKISFLTYERLSAVDGLYIDNTPQLQRIFDGNDYNMNAGAVGCALSYFKSFIELIYSKYDAYLFLEDDVEIVPNFDVKLKHVCEKLKHTNYDVAFLGHHERHPRTTTNDDDLPDIEKWDIYTSFQNSLGGTIGFLITKAGAQKYLNFVNRNKLINCIDTSLQKSANELNVYYCCPTIVRGECVRPGVNVDTDIQHNGLSLSQPTEEKIKHEIYFFSNNGYTVVDIPSPDDIEQLQSDNTVAFSQQNLPSIRRACDTRGISYYTLDEKVIFVLPKGVDRYNHIFMKEGKYSIADTCV